MLLKAVLVYLGVWLVLAVMANIYPQRFGRAQSTRWAFYPVLSHCHWLVGLHVRDLGAMGKVIEIFPMPFFGWLLVWRMREFSND